MEYFRRQDFLILSSLFLIFPDCASSSNQEDDLKAVTIPRAIESVSIKTVVETTQCSVTCGLGSKMEKRCLVDKSGIRKDCATERVDCFSTWLCGIQVYTLKAGDPFTVDCQIPPTGTVGSGLGYYWKIAHGVISVNDIYFRALKIRNSTIVFQSIQEKDAGTYHCDVQRYDDYKLVKRIYFGLRIITPGIIDINFDKYVINKQKLAAMAEGLTTEVVKKKVELYGGTYSYIGLGSAVGILTGMFALLLFRWTSKRQRFRSTIKL